MDGWYGQRDQVGWMLNARLMGKTLLTPWSTYWPPLHTNIVILRVRMTMQSTIDRRLVESAPFVTTIRDTCDILSLFSTTTYLTEVGFLAMYTMNITLTTPARWIRL